MLPDLGELIDSAVVSEILIIPGDSVYINALVENATQVELMVSNNEYSTFFESIEMRQPEFQRELIEDDFPVLD